MHILRRLFQESKCPIINIMLNRISKTTDPPLSGLSFQEPPLLLYVQVITQFLFPGTLPHENRLKFFFRTIAHE